MTSSNGQPTPAQILEAIQNLQTGIDQRFDLVEQRFDTIDRRFDSVETRLDQLESDVREIRDTQLSEQEKLKDVFEIVMRIPDEMLNPPPSSQG